MERNGLSYWSRLFFQFRQGSKLFCSMVLHDSFYPTQRFSCSALFFKVEVLYSMHVAVEEQTRDFFVLLLHDRECGRTSLDVSAKPKAYGDSPHRHLKHQSKRSSIRSWLHRFKHRIKQRNVLDCPFYLSWKPILEIFLALPRKRSFSHAGWILFPPIAIILFTPKWTRYLWCRLRANEQDRSPIPIEWNWRSRTSDDKWIVLGWLEDGEKNKREKR